MPKIGENIKRYRLAKKWSQQDLAVAAGLSVSNIVKLESTRHAPRIVTLVGIARALGVPVMRLLEDAASTRPKAA